MTGLKMAAIHRASAGSSNGGHVPSDATNNLPRSVGGAQFAGHRGNSRRGIAPPPGHRGGGNVPALPPSRGRRYCRRPPQMLFARSALPPGATGAGTAGRPSQPSLSSASIWGVPSPEQRAERRRLAADWSGEPRARPEQPERWRSYPAAPQDCEPSASRSGGRYCCQLRSRRASPLTILIR